MKWTQQQQQVISLRDRNLLVSAAAGSGKTAVLVERIKEKITDPKRPLDIDQLLIVTFTKAAAAEMRERIGLAVEQALEERPEDVHLQRQQTLLHTALITTIDSFCLYVIRNYFHQIDLDPEFRVGDEGELKLLRGDVLDRVLEGYYEKADPDFLALSETIATGKNDLPLKETVLKLYEFAMSYPWVEQWLADCRKPYQVSTPEELEALPLTGELIRYAGNLAEQWRAQINMCRNISLTEDGPEMYAPLLEGEAEALKRLAECESFQEFYEQIQGFSFGRLPAARKFAGDPGKKEEVQKLRNEVKASLKKTKEQFFFQSPEQTAKDLGRNRPVAEMLVEVVGAFREAYRAKKRERNMLDFHDMEHFALEILVDRETKKPTRAALELQKRFEEIMIDEYQDSNYVQEAILTAVSGQGEGRHNIFMVGDVKQSIYRFRMARPELFMEKYHTYTKTESENQRIDLHQNFRSRPTVLSAVNDMFFRIMKEDLGNVTYDKEAALYPGAEFPEGEPGMFDLGFLVVEPEEGESEVRDRELEARAAGREIRAMMEGQLVTDKETGDLRPLRYSDIVILLRSPGNWSDTFLTILGEMGIPARAAAGTGYFSAVEVQTALNLLRVIDNPRQDIPLAAVLASPIVGLTGEELALLRGEAPGEKFYQTVLHSGESGRETELSPQTCRKLQDFLQLLEKYRGKVSYTPIHELLYQVLQETGYEDYVYALPGGEGRRANLKMLEEKAIAYESTSYRGLFHFIRYMEQLRKYDVDFALADAKGQEDMVRLMSIHKSKGLEFPVVLVCGLGKRFNTQDVRERVVLHPGYGIGMDVLDVERRLRTPGLTRQVLARLTAMENVGEELRVLYVAMTRAREKLVLIGTMKKASEKLEGMHGSAGEDGFLTFLTRLNTTSFLGFLLMAQSCYGEKYSLSVIPQQELMEELCQEAAARELTRIQLLAGIEGAGPEQEKLVEQKLSYVYPYAAEENMHTKVSVSELKHRAMERMAAEEAPAAWVRKPEPERCVPAFLQGVKEENTGARRGTAAHRLLECFDFTRPPESLEMQIQELTEKGRLKPELAELIYPPAMERFLASSLARRIAEAAQRGKLYREKPFVMGRPAREVLEHVDSGEIVLIQGIIDVFFEEQDGIVLLDYKTDWVEDGRELADRYRAQLELYQEAIERALDKQVKEKLLYSFRLAEVIQV